MGHREVDWRASVPAAACGACRSLAVAMAKDQLVGALAARAGRRVRQRVSEGPKEDPMPRISRGFRGRRPQVGATRVPPGQYVTTDFPVLSAGPTPHTPLDEWTFTI